jgi:hypothetical protein
LIVVQILRTIPGKGENMAKDHPKAPDIELVLSDGSRRRISEFWREGGLVLVFLRHLG